MAKLRVKRVPHRYRSLLMSVALSVSMPGVVSFIVTARNVGLCAGMTDIWLAAWQLSCAIAVPARFVVSPIVTRVVGMFIEPSAPRQATQ
jgi:hypothetical protein